MMAMKLSTTGNELGNDFFHAKAGLNEIRSPYSTNTRRESRGLKRDWKHGAGNSFRNKISLTPEGFRWDRVRSRDAGNPLRRIASR